MQLLAHLIGEQMHSG